MNQYVQNYLQTIQCGEEERDIFGVIMICYLLQTTKI